MKQDILNELSNVRYTEIKETEPTRKIQNNKYQKETIMEAENGKRNRTSMRGAIYTDYTE